MSPWSSNSIKSSSFPKVTVPSITDMTCPSFFCMSFTGLKLPVRFNDQFCDHIPGLRNPAPPPVYWSRLRNKSKMSMLKCSLIMF